MPLPILAGFLTIALVVTVITAKRTRASARTATHVLDALGWVSLMVAAWLIVVAAYMAGGVGNGAS